MDLRHKLFTISLLSSAICSNLNASTEYITKEIKIQVSDIIETNETMPVETPNLSEDKDVNQGDYVFLEDTLQTKKQRQVYEDLKTDIAYNMENYVVGKGDTIDGISNRVGLSNYNDLVLLNSLLGKELKKHRRKKNVIILKRGEDIYVPRQDRLDIINESSSLVKEIKRTLDLNQIVELDISDNVLDSIAENIYPKRVQALGLEKMLGGFIEAQKQEFDPYLPHIVDVARQETVSCANLIRTLMAFSVVKENLSDDEWKFFQKQGLDAWILPEALIDIGYEQSFNLMDNFSEALIGNINPIPHDLQEYYDNDILFLGKYLENNGKVGSILPLYFRYSHYKGVVRYYNIDKERKHYNTHQTILAGIDTISFKASEVGKIKNLKITKFEDLENKEMTIFDYLTNFVQQRGDYGRSALADWQKRIVQENLHKFYALINIKVNGDKIDLGEEFLKDDSEMLKIKSDDIIELYGPIMIDGLHMVNSYNPDKVKNMNARTRFYFEFIIIGNFLVSELLEPQEGVLGVGDTDDRIVGQLETKGVYALKMGDMVESVIKEKILVYEREKFEKLDKNDLNYEKKYNNLLNYYYSLQINALKISGYMQSENKINPRSFNINAPIPYFKTDNINKIFMEYISNKKEEIKVPNLDIRVMRCFIQITTLPGDSYKSILNRIKDEVEFHSKYNIDLVPNFSLFLEFNELQQRKFLELFIDTSIKTEDVNGKDYLNGKIGEGVHMILTLVEVDKIIGKISKQYYSPDIGLLPVDEFAIDLVIPVSENNNMVENVLYLENYTPVGSHGLKRKIKQILEYNTILQLDFEVFGKKVKSEINSYGDYQLRLFNLYRGLDEEWPNRKQLLKAFSYLEKSKFKKYVESLPYSDLVLAISKIDDEDLRRILKDRLPNFDKSRIKRDLEIVQKIKFLIIGYDYVGDETKKIYREKIIYYLQQILLLDNGTGSNIVGKIVGTSLVNDKLNLHFQKFNGILQASGERIEDIYNDEDKMRSYERVVLLINNLGESTVVYGLAENYLIRIFNTFESITHNHYKYPCMKKTSILGQFVYGVNTFKGNIEFYKLILDEIKMDLEIVYTTDNYHDLRNALDELTFVLDSFSDPNNRKYTVEKIYDMFKNPIIKDFLLNYNKSLESGNANLSLLPGLNEFSGTDFRYIFFRYTNTIKIERVGPGFLSRLVPDVL